MRASCVRQSCDRARARARPRFVQQPCTVAQDAALRIARGRCVSCSNGSSVRAKPNSRLPTRFRSSGRCGPVIAAGFCAVQPALDRARCVASLHVHRVAALDSILSNLTAADGSADVAACDSEWQLWTLQLSAAVLCAGICASVLPMARSRVRSNRLCGVSLPRHRSCSADCHARCSAVCMTFTSLCMGERNHEVHV